MTSEQYDKMSFEEATRKILELWGWKNLHYNDQATCDMSEVGLIFRGDLGVHHNLACPDVINDLNAMHEAVENAVTAERYPSFDHVLQNVMGGEWCYTSRANSAQRAKALVLFMDQENEEDEGSD